VSVPSGSIHGLRKDPHREWLTSRDTAKPPVTTVGNSPSRVTQFGGIGGQLSVGMPTFGSKNYLALSNQSAISSTGVKRQQRQARSRRTRKRTDRFVVDTDTACIKRF
jgi:hypothetical protein